MRTLAFLFIMTVFVVADERPKPPPPFAGDLSTAPQQGRPWAPATDKASKEWHLATEKLLEYGLADPRGCEYRQVELVVGSVWSNRGGVAKTHAFVVPSVAEDETAQRFAIAWNGVLYPLVAVGEPADLAVDVADMVKKNPPTYRRAKPEPDAISQKSNDLVKCALLLVYGREELASDLIAALGKVELNDKDPYLPLVTQWAWFHFDRAICAHIRGDDVISLASARAAQAIDAAVEKDAPVRGIARRKDFRGGPARYIDFLGNIDRLVRDQERRVALNPGERQPVDWKSLTDANERIKTLIRNLEFIDETQFSQPGGVHLQGSPIIQVLTNEGDAAVEPLIDCLENDDRLVRSVFFHRDFFPNRGLLSVGDASYSALTAILKTKTFGPATEHGYRSSSGGKPADAVRELRDYWQRSKNLPEMEQAFAILANDKGTETQWLEAAKKLVSPVTVANAPSLPEIVRRMLPPNPAAGAKLASRKSPSVTELLIRRADSITELDPENTQRIHHLSNACQLTLNLVQWDPAAAREPIRKRLEQCRAMQTDKFYGPYAKALQEPLAKLLAAGMVQGDKTLAVEYAAWLGGLSPDQVETFRPAAPFLPLVHFPDDPHLANVAQAVFASPDSRWRPLHEKLSMHWRDLLASPLVSVPAFRELLAHELTNIDELGTISVDIEKRMMTVKLRGSVHGKSLVNSRDPDLPPAPGPRPVRVCDVYAWHLSGLEGSQRFEPYWPEAKKDAAIKKYPEFLQKWGPCFQEYLPPWSMSRFRGDPIRFHLLTADGKFLNKSLLPASESDVEEGRAIFSLDDIQAERRTIPLTMFPHMARWKTLKQFPLNPNRGKDGVEQERFDQAGFVWQAEEVLIDSKWQRFYGFVGKHIIAKVPAEEIDLLEKISEEPSLR